MLATCAHSFAKAENAQEEVCNEDLATTKELAHANKKEKFPCCRPRANVADLGRPPCREATGQVRLQGQEREKPAGKKPPTWFGFILGFTLAFRMSKLRLTAFFQLSHRATAQARRP